MKSIKVGSGVVNQTPMDWEQNKTNLLEAIEAARAEQVDILCLPELAITGYGCEDAFHSPNVCEQAIETLLEIKDHTLGMVLCVGLPISFQNRLYNAACLMANRQILGFVCKQHLPNYGIFYEDRWFQRWPAGQKGMLEIENQLYPVGDLLFEVGGIRMGIEICEDAWVPSRPGDRLFCQGVDIILNPSASPFEFFKFQMRERLVVESSRIYNCTYIYTNLLGNEAGRLIFDGDAQIASNGQMLATSPRFSYANHTLTTAVVDPDEGLVDAMKIKTPAVSTDNLVRFDYVFVSGHKPVFHEPGLEAFEKGGFLKEEEFARAVSLALFDYLRKSGLQGFTVSLSGGADSSAITALCGLMIRLADESIGLRAMKAKLAHIQKIQDKDTVAAIGREIVYAIYQGTENSSKETRNSAKKLAESVGATFYSIEINDLVSKYTQLIEEQIGRKLIWETDDISLQNIQARVRAPSAWLLTNITGHLLLSTSNRSEAAVGYATMDGDTAGSLSPIAGIDKHWLRKWLVWLEKTGCEVKGKHIRIEGLKYVNALSPTAELRPKEYAQTDEKDLMPYEVLDVIEELAVKDKKTPVEAFRHLEVRFTGRFVSGQLADWVKRFYTLWSRNQWKRERYPISFHLDNRNLDPRSWCRFPILSGGFKKEMQELDDYLSGLPGKARPGIGFKQKS